MKKSAFFFCLLLLCSVAVHSQTYYGNDARQVVPGAEMVVKSNYSGIPSFIRFSEGSGIEFRQFEGWLGQHFRIDPVFGLKLLRTEEDRWGFMHYRYQQTYHGIPLLANIFIVHVRNGRIESMNGQLFEKLDAPSSVLITEAAALDVALGEIGAVTYKWQQADEEQWLKKLMNDERATYYPTAELFMVPSDGNYQGSDYRLAFRFDIYAHQPSGRNFVFVDAQNGKVLLKIDRIHAESGQGQVNATGTAYTAYSGTRTFTTDYTGSTYRLRETGRGLGIETYDMNMGTNYGASVDFTDANNSWNNVNADQDEVATDAHWGGRNGVGLL